MIAIILSGGFATRLGKISTYTPKTLLTIGGKTIFEHQLEKIEQINQIKQIYILTNTRFKQTFYELSSKYMILHPNKQIIVLEQPNTYYPKDNKGSIQGLYNFIKTYNVIDDSLILGSDNFFTFSLEPLIKAYKKYKSPVVITRKIKNKEYLSKLAVATIRGNKIIKYDIKPKRPKTKYAGTMIYILPKEHIPKIIKLYESGITNPTGKIIQHLIKQKIPVYSKKINYGTWFDIGHENIYKQVFDFYEKNKGSFDKSLKI